MKYYFKQLLQLQEYAEVAAVEFEKLQQCNMFSLREDNLVMAMQLEKIKASQIEVYLIFYDLVFNFKFLIIFL